MINRHSILARGIHWFTALAILILVILGFWMTQRAAANLWDNLTNMLYGWHKLIGFSVLLITIFRFFLKLSSKTPEYPNNISPRLMRVASKVHYILYGLLFIVPMLGWAGVTAYPALITIGGYSLPAMPGIPKSELIAKQIFQIHGLLAMALIAVALLHIAAALNHLIIKRDGIFQRIWFDTKK
ncbi:MAG TPA: cytochrome b/b6 domain-containing protein [Polynucleobacter sp.]|nr:cytochrome b/b6 domain-containing protein [Polynucleobacter sp.]